MKISYKSDYALKAVLDLALCYEGRQPVSIHDTAKRIDAPVKFLEQIFSGLKGHGVIESRRGSNGGYLLAKPPEKINLRGPKRSKNMPTIGASRPTSSPLIDAAMETLA